jgi:hypothetical protein
MSKRDFDGTCAGVVKCRGCLTIKERCTGKIWLYLTNYMKRNFTTAGTKEK